ncbi:MAG: ComF family protein [Patescibacteria group bacterium]|nr:ComF family protein [Patescibacteria group bacterium]
MRLLRSIYGIVIDALFPPSDAEREALSLTPDTAANVLPPAPPYAGLTVPLPECRSILAYKDERVYRLIWALKYKKSWLAGRIAGWTLWHELTGGRERYAPPSAPGVPSPAVHGWKPPDKAFLTRVESCRTRATSRRFLARNRLRSVSQALSGGVPTENLPSLIIVPMPITGRRRRERGYNQCELITDEMAHLESALAASAGGAPRFMVKEDLLLRIQHSSRQTLKGRADRMTSAKGIFAVDDEAARGLQEAVDASHPSSDGRMPAGGRTSLSRLIVIDDVITTGSTMREAIDTLKAAGFRDVRGLSLAH